MKCFAYTDESGNSGQNLFDGSQETFWTGTLIAFADVDTRYRSAHRELLDIVQKQELHGAELGFGRIEKLAPRLSCLIRDKKLRFSFVRVHKPYLAGLKFFDVVFDSGTNSAAPPHTYGVRHLRLINLMHFLQLLEESDLREFWDLFQSRDFSAFARLLERLTSRVHDTRFDSRSKQILIDSLEWGSKHPEVILDPFGESDSPNFVAFTAVFQHLHKFHQEEGHVIGCFIHDEQNQFVPSFQRAFKFLSKYKGEMKPSSIISDLEPIASFECDLEIRSSAQSFGLQLIDVATWIVKRVLERGEQLRGECQKLFACLVQHSWITEYNFAALVSEVRQNVKAVEAVPLTAEKMEAGKRWLAEIEASRLRRMSDKPDSSD